MKKTYEHDYKPEFRNYALSTAPLDQDSAKTAILNLIEINNSKIKNENKNLVYLNSKPKFWFFDSPRDAKIMAAKLASNYAALNNFASRPTEDWEKELDNIQLSEDEITGVVNKACFGSLESYWVGYYVYKMIEEQEATNAEDVRVMYDIVKNTFIHWIFQNGVVMLNRPEKINYYYNNYEIIIHAVNEPAIRFRDGTEFFVYNNKKVHDKLETIMLDKLKFAETR